MKPVILLVDNDPEFLNLAERLLSKKHWEIKLASDAESAIGCMNFTKPDLVVTDLKLPRQSGLELTAHIVRTHPEVPVVILTGRGDEQHAIEGFRLGAADYVRKELVHDELVRCVGKLLKEERRVEATIRSEAAGADPIRLMFNRSAVTLRQDNGETHAHRIEVESEFGASHLGISVANGCVVSGFHWNHCEPRLRVFRRTFGGAASFGTDDVVVMLSKMSAPISERKFPRLAT